MEKQKKQGRRMVIEEVEEVSEEEEVKVSEIF